MPNTVKNIPKQRQIAIPEQNPLFEGLNKEQVQAVRHTDGPLLIVAGAGTGKTTVITRRIAYLVKEGLCKGDEIAALTFTEKAAGEMQERVDVLLPLGYFDSWISTFHGFCERILKAHGLDIGLPNDFQLLSETDQWIFVYKNIDEFKLNYYKPLGNPAKFVTALLKHFSRCKDEMIQPEDYLKYGESLRLDSDQTEQGNRQKTTKKAVSDLIPNDLSLIPAADEAEISRIEELANAYHTYQRLLLKHNYLDFGDLINYTLQLFKKRPKILGHYQDKFRYIMVDEFQDTNVAQYELVKMIADGRKNLVVVGDDDQSIYKFRGASVSNILKFKEDYPEFKELTLVENYRSSQKILDLAYNFIQANNPDRLEVKLNISKKLKANTEDPGVVEVIEAEDLHGELDAVAKKILNLKSGDQLTTWNDFAVLIRANSAADEFLPILFQYGIPYTFFANRGLYKKPIILELLSYLKLLDNGHDSSSLYKVLKLPKFYLSHEDLSLLLQHAHKKSVTLYEALCQVRAGLPGISEDARKKAVMLLEILAKHTQLTQRCHAAEVFVHVIKDLGIEERVKEETLEAVENRELIEQFYKKIESFQQQDDDKSLHNFLVTLNLESEAGNEGEIKFDPNIGPESLKVMTIHSSKGLEFKYVFVINMVDQRFPTREKADAIEIPEELIKDILPQGDFHLQEERRLFYVAMTRAKSQLFLSWAKDYGGSRAKKPSQFLLETKLVPSDAVSKATGKVVFAKQAKIPDAVYTALPTQFSYSQLSDFETCPLKYKYQHYLKLPVEGSCHLSFGQTIHKVFEEYLKLYKNNLELPQQDLFGKKPDMVLPAFKFLEELYEKHWVDDWYKNKKEKEEYRMRGREMLKTFYEYTEKYPCRPKYIEQRFELSLGDYKFTGKIDRGDWAEDGIIILDYKTGKVPKKSDKKDLDQLYIYQWAAQEYLREKVYGLKYWYLHPNEFIEETIAEENKVGELKARLLALIEKIVHTTKFDLFREEHKHAKDHDCQFEYLE